MPHHFEPKSIVPSNEFNMEDNPDAVLGVQANESFLLKAQGGHVLGSGGETKGFAKYQFEFDEALSKNYTNQANEIETQLAEIATQEVIDYNNLSREVNEVLPDLLEKAEQEKILCQSLPENDKKRIESNLQVEQIKSQLTQATKKIEIARERPGVKAYLELKVKSTELKARAERPHSIADSTKDLYAENRNEKGKLIPMKTGEGGDRALLTRAVASKLVDNLIGTNSLAEEKFGVDKNGRPVGISIQVDGAGVIGKYQGKDYYLNVDYSDSDIQKGLSDLEVNDYITGQLDRHCGNIFIDPVTKKVTGIDNDISLPDYDRELAFNRTTAQGKAVKGLPGFIHKDTADKIAQIDPDELQRKLAGMEVPNGVNRLSENSINGAVARLKNLQAGIKNGSVKVVEKFDRQTYQANIDKQNEAVKARCNDRDLSQVNKGDDWNLKFVNPTSYQGAVAVQVKRYQVNGIELRNSNTVKQAERNQRHQGFAKLGKDEREQYEKIANEMGDLEKKLADCRESLDKLNTKPKGVARIAAYFNRKEVDDKKLEMLKLETKLTSDLRSRAAELDKLAGVGKLKQGNDLQQEPVENQIQSSKTKEIEMSPQQSELLRAFQELPTEQQEQMRQRSNSTEIPNEDIDKLLKEMDTYSVDELETDVEENQVTPNKIKPGNVKEREMSLEESELLREFQKLPTEQQEQMRQRSNSLDIPNEEIDRLLKEMEADGLDELETQSENLTQNEGVTKQSLQGNDVGEEETIEITEDLEEVEITQRDRLAIEKLNKLNGNETPSRDRSNSVGAKLGLKKVGSGATTEQSQHQSLKNQKVGDSVKQENNTQTVAIGPKFKAG